MNAFEKYVGDNFGYGRNPLNLSATDLATLYIMTTGLGGEAGEVMEHLKKYVRDGKLDKQELKLELGDLHHYFTMICLRFGFTVAEIEAANIAKLDERRKTRGW